MSDSTIQYYNDNAERYATDTFTADMEGTRKRFLKYIPVHGRILDAGCGSGRDTAAFLADGYNADAFDASENMCRIASENTGICVQQKCFEELNGELQYDGIWACASLLHVEKNKMSDVLNRLQKLLKTEGVLYASFKYGDGERMQGTRYYYDVTETECTKLMKNAGLSILELFQTNSVLPGRNQEQWINVIAKKQR